MLKSAVIQFAIFSVSSGLPGEARGTPPRYSSKGFKAVDDAYRALKNCKTQLCQNGMGKVIKPFQRAGDAVSNSIRRSSGRLVESGRDAANRIAAAFGKKIQSVDDVLKNPHLLRGKGTMEVQKLLEGSKGWVSDTLAKGTRVGEGWRFMQIGANGKPTGAQIRFSPGSLAGRKGGKPYWRVSSPRWGKSAAIPGRIP